jgi:hypothetical protein
MPPEPLLTPPSFPPLIPLLTSPSSSMALKSLTSPLLPPTTPPRRSPNPYKRVMRPSALAVPHPLPLELLRALFYPRDELKPPPFAASSAPPRCHSFVTGEHLPSTASTGSSSPSVTDEHQRAPAPARQRGAATPSVRGPPWTGAVRGPPHRGFGPRNFPLKIKSGNRLFQEFCKDAPQFL